MANPDVLRKILDILRREQAEAGFHIREQWLADTLGVSRSPVRTALKTLEQLDLVRSEQNQGYFLKVASGSPEFERLDLPETSVERIYRQIASERFANLVGEQVSIADLVRRYGASRAVVLKVLGRMQEEGLVEKTAGHSWQFGPALNDEASYQESYRYRMVIEPAALLEPAFHMAPKRLARLKRQHEEVIAERVMVEPVTDLFDIDAEFHDTLADACGNRFLTQAIHQQTRLRRLSEYEKYNSRERLSQSFGEHLEILASIEADDRGQAAKRMRAHIQASDQTRPDFRKVRVLAHRRLTRR